MENVTNDKDERLWIIKWNQFLTSLKKTIEEDETKLISIDAQDFVQIEAIREIIDFRMLYSYLKEHQIEYARAWIFRFERSMDEILEFALSRFNCPHSKELDQEVVIEYEDDIAYVNEERENFSEEGMRDIPDILEEIQKFYLEYKNRILDYESNLEYRKKYYRIRKVIEKIPKENLFVSISSDDEAYIYVSKEYKNMFDSLLEEMDAKWRSYELEEYELYYQKLQNYDVEFVYDKIPYYDFHQDASLSEKVYRYGCDEFIDERAIIDAFEDDDRLIK